MEEKKTDLVSLLLRPELPNVLKELPTARYRVKRLSELTGEEVVFTLRGLPYGKVQQLREEPVRRCIRPHPAPGLRGA